MFGLCRCEGTSLTIPNPPTVGSNLAISKVSCKFSADRGCCEGASRIVTTFEMGRSCNAPIRNVGVSCIEVIPKEKISSTGVCVTPGKYGIRFLGAGAIGLLSASNVLIMESLVR